MLFVCLMAIFVSLVWEEVRDNFDLFAHYVLLGHLDKCFDVVVFSLLIVVYFIYLFFIPYILPISLCLSGYMSQSLVYFCGCVVYKCQHS